MDEWIPRSQIEHTETLIEEELPIKKKSQKWEEAKKDSIQAGDDSENEVKKRTMKKLKK